MMGAGVGDGFFLAEKMFVENRRHGVTYSWLKRRSVARDPVSPGFTASTPTLVGAVHHMAREDLFAHGHGTRFV